MKWPLIVAFGLVLVRVAYSQSDINQIQRDNLDILRETLPLGWRAFCEAPVDEGVMAMFNNANPSDASLHLLTLNNQSVILPIRALAELGEFNINPRRKTLLYVNAFYTDVSYFSVLAHLELLQQRRTDLNVIILDVAKNLPQLYYSLRHHATVQAYFVSKILVALVKVGIRPSDITLAGHSVGANIVAQGADFYISHSNGVKIGQLIAIDPAQMCDPSDIYVRPNVSDRVLVIHGEGDIFGIRRPLGTIDIYPNGIGMTSREKQQPGCDTALCSHMYPFVLFMEALIENAMISAVRCDNWNQFRKRQCDYSDTVAIGLRYREGAKGSYFCVTRASPPFTFMEYGLKY